MKTLKVLIVDDDTLWSETLQDNIRTVSPIELAGREYGEFDFTLVTNQQDADQAVLAADNAHYDLVLLDLRYPSTPGGPLDEDENTEFQGMQWLPALRRLQPNATIVILTSYAGQTHLQNVVRAIRDHHANDFIPKTAPFDEIAARVHVAWDKARQIQQLLMLEEEFHSLLRSRATRAYAEDVAALLNQTKASLYRIAQRIESGNTSAIDTAARSIRSEFDNLNMKFVELTDKLNEGQEHCREVDVVTLVQQMILLYQRMIDSVPAEIIPPNGAQSFRLVTFDGDLKVVLHEVIANALDSLQHSKTPANERKLKIAVDAVDDSVMIRVIDNGDGFSDEAKTRMFERGYSSKDERHQGLGLYVAKRMMHQIGGEIEVRDNHEGGAEVDLIVRNLGGPC